MKSFFRKLMIAIGSLLLSAVILCVLIAVYLEISSNQMNEATSTAWKWERENSYLVDVKLHPDGEMVDILYALRFTNLSDDVVHLAPVNANFRRKDLSGWMEYEQMFDGTRLDGEYDTILPPNETIDVVFCFSGKFLGGDINRNIAPPAELLYMYHLSSSP